MTLHPYILYRSFRLIAVLKTCCGAMSRNKLAKMLRCTWTTVYCVRVQRLNLFSRKSFNYIVLRDRWTVGPALDLNECQRYAPCYGPSQKPLIPRCCYSVGPLDRPLPPKGGIGATLCASPLWCMEPENISRLINKTIIFDYILMPARRCAARRFL